jgi:2-methylisocitrate lyase-like PEP mutase family enzyme
VEETQMADQKTKAEQFAALHQKGAPVVLYNAWDPGSAKVVANAGAKAVATGSYSVAGALGFEDRENAPLDLVLDNCRRIVGAVDLPVTLDFESGYAVEIDGLKRNIEAVIAAGAIGINFEDQAIGGQGLHPTGLQAARVAAVREAADKALPGFFINARCDVFLQSERSTHAAGMGQWLERAKAYADAGADGLFAPGLVDADLIGQVVEKVSLPLNILMFPGAPEIPELRRRGVARISYGGAPWRVAMQALEAGAKAVFAA